MEHSTFKVHGHIRERERELTVTPLLVGSSFVAMHRELVKSFLLYLANTIAQTTWLHAIETTQPAGSNREGPNEGGCNREGPWPNYLVLQPAGLGPTAGDAGIETAVMQIILLFKVLFCIKP